MFERAGYGEIYTPALEYESVITAGLRPSAAEPGGGEADGDEARPAYRVFDEHGDVLVLRSDMTLPIARVVATRYAHSEPPLRFCYFAHAYRGVRRSAARPREFLQAGIELIGSPAPEGTAEALAVLCAALDAAGLRDYRVGLGDASLYGRLLDAFAVAADARERVANELVKRDFVGLERELAALDLDDDAIALLLRVPQMRGGPDVLDAPSGPVADAVARIKGVRDLLPESASERVIFDLGLARGLGYYTGRRVRGLRPGARGPARRRWALRRAARALRAAAAGRRLRAQRRAPAHRARRRGARMNGLTIAVPRGALFDGTLDLLDRLGIDTAEVRSNDRKLLFEEVGLITMRPSDVPTYVEAGAADLGITGKDVLMEQRERDVYELLDLGYGRCRMVLATRAGGRPAAEALRRLGVMRIATKYPRIAARYFEETGRQAEIVEVKGSVELAPLTGLVEAIVDLTATGTTLAENGLVVREEIAACTARLIANPVAAQAQGGRDRRRAGARCVRVERAALDADPAAAARALRASTEVDPEVEATRARDRRRGADRGDEAVTAFTRELDTGGADPGPLAVPREELTAALERADPALVAALELAAGNVRDVAAAGVGADRDVALPQGQRVPLREVPVRRAAVYVPGGRAPYPSTVVMGAVTARVAGVEQVVVCGPPGPDGRVHDAILAACALCGVDEVYADGRRAGGRRARATGPRRCRRSTSIVGPGNVYVQEAKRQVAHLVGIDGFAGPSELVVILDDAEAASDVALDLLAQAEHGPDSPVVAVSPSSAALDAVAAGSELRRRGAAGRRGPAGRLLDAPDLDAALAFAEAFAPEHLSSSAPAPRRWPRAYAPRAACSSGPAAQPPSATTWPAPTTCCPPAAPRASRPRSRRATSAAGWPRCRSPAGAGRRRAAGAAIARAEGFPVHAESMEARMGENQAT